MTFRTALFLLILGGGSALLLLVNSGWREDPDNTETHAGSGLPPTSLNEDDRALLWDIEHHANVLSKYGWSKVCAALMEGDRTSLGSLLHKDLEVAFPENRLENSAPSQWAAVSRLTGTDGIRDLLPESGDRQIARDPVPAGETPEAKNASTSGADADVAEGTGSDTARRSTHSAPSVPSARLTGCLLNLRDEFVDAPRVNVEQVGISPNDPANFDGTWNSRFRLRFRGRTSSEEMRETVVRCFLRTRRPTESILSAGEWILEWRVISVDSVISPQPLMADVTQASGLKTETLFDNWDQPKGQPRWLHRRAGNRH